MLRWPVSKRCWRLPGSCPCQVQGLFLAFHKDSGTMFISTSAINGISVKKDVTCAGDQSFLIAICKPLQVWQWYTHKKHHHLRTLWIRETPSYMACTSIPIARQISAASASVMNSPLSCDNQRLRVETGSPVISSSCYSLIPFSARMVARWRFAAAT